MSSVEGIDNGTGYGVKGTSTASSGSGVYGENPTGYGVRGLSNGSYGVYGQSTASTGVYGQSTASTGVYGWSVSGWGVYGYTYSNIGVYGESVDGWAVYGYSNTSIGVYGWSNRGTAVNGHSASGYGVRGSSDSNIGVYGTSGAGLAAYLDGNVRVSGYIHKGGGGFKIDHPLDPANKYLHHSFVESPDMKNVYDGVVSLDDRGEAEIDLPQWFGALNKDFRYQLTAIGAPGPNLYIAEEISEAITTSTNHSGSSNNNNSHFKIAGGTSGMKVSWQVTGIRRDPWANANRIQIEEDKPTKERGYYLHPDVYGQHEENGISHLLFPKEEEKKQERIINEN